MRSNPARTAQLCAYQYDFVCVGCRREAGIEFRLNDRQGVAELSRRRRGLEVLAGDHFRDCPSGHLLVEADARDLVAAILHRPQLSAGEYQAVDVRDADTGNSCASPRLGLTV